MFDEIENALQQLFRSEQRGSRRAVVFHPVAPLPVGKPYTPPPTPTIPAYVLDVARRPLAWGDQLKRDTDAGTFRTVEQLTRGKIRSTQLDAMEEAQKRKKIESFVLGPAGNKAVTEGFDRLLKLPRAGRGEEAALQQQEAAARVARSTQLDAAALVRAMTRAGAAYASGQQRVSGQPVRAAATHKPGATEPDAGLIAPLMPMWEADP